MPVFEYLELSFTMQFIFSVKANKKLPKLIRAFHQHIEINSQFHWISDFKNVFVRV